MSALVVPDEGEKRMLDCMVNGYGSTGWRLALFQNNLTPGPSTVFADLTLATFSGYAEVTPAFGAATTVSDKGQTEDTFQRTFVCDGGGIGNTIYGYVVYDALVNVILWAERFDFSVVMTTNGNTIRVTTKLTAASEN